ncbi:MAG: HNH endonuclease [Fibromonadales bacterium]|nr:HNH endonuclease [Fibromonadales bacterium]
MTDKDYDALDELLTKTTPKVGANGTGFVSKLNAKLFGLDELSALDELPTKTASKPTKVFTSADIVWFKNVNYEEKGEAYLDLPRNVFELNFPKKTSQKNVLDPAINEIILIYQKVHGTPAFTHLVTPVDNELIFDKANPGFCHARRVKVIAKTDKNNFIPVSTTMFNNVRLSGITQGNVCRLSNVKGISSIGNLKKLQADIWQKFSKYLVLSESPEITYSAISTEVEFTNPELTVPEGKEQLVSHIIKERNRRIVNEKKQQATQNNNLKCEVCAFSFPKTYDMDFIECHHLTPIGQGGVRETKLEDLALVCANCHRMLHKKFGGQYLSINQLQEKIFSLRKISKDPDN